MQVLGLAFSADRRFLVSVGRGGPFRPTVWDVTSPVPRPIATLSDLATHALAFSGDGKMLAVGGSGNKVFVYETQAWRVTGELPVNAYRTSGLAFSADGKTLLTASLSGEVKFWQVGLWQELGTLRMNEKVWKRAFLDDNTLVTASMEGFVRVWRATPLHSTQDE